MRKLKRIVTYLFMICEGAYRSFFALIHRTCGVRFHLFGQHLCKDSYSKVFRDHQSSRSRCGWIGIDEATG